MVEINGSLVQGVINTMIDALFQLIWVVIILSLGVILGRVAEAVVAKALKKIKLDEWISNNNLQKPLGTIKLSSLGGSITKWYVILIAIQVSTDFLRMPALSNILAFFATYIPLAIVALVIFVTGMLFARWVRNKISKSQAALAQKVGQVAEVIILYIALIIALRNLGLDVAILEAAFVSAFSAFAIVVAIIFGISFYPLVKTDVDTLIADIRKMGRK